MSIFRCLEDLQEQEMYVKESCLPIPMKKPIKSLKGWKEQTLAECKNLKEWPSYLKSDAKTSS